MKHLIAVSALALAVPAVAQPKTASGSAGGLSWTATNTIVGQTSTGTVATGGNPIYLARNSQGYSGVVGILTTYKNGDQFVCSGSLTNNFTVVTAGHCVSDGRGIPNQDLVRTQVVFANNAASNADLAIYNPANLNVPGSGVTSIDANFIKVNPNYTGEVVDQNDIAMIRLSQIAPDYVQRYTIYNGGDLTGADYNIAGYGTRSVVGGAEGTTGPGAGAGVGRRRQGDNRFDFRWGDSDFGGFFTDRDANGENIFGKADVAFGFVADFDNGLAANDASCALAAAFDLPTSGKYCNLGRGATEVSSAGGDSGGPQFINGQLAAVTSYGLVFGNNNLGADFKPGLNNSFGEFAGYVPTYIHRDFLVNFQAVPEPATWLQMIAGFGLIGGTVRSLRRRKPAAAAA